MARSVRILGTPTCAHRVVISGEPPRMVSPADLLAIVEKHQRDSSQASIMLSFTCERGTDVCEHHCDVEYEDYREQKMIPLSEIVLIHRAAVSSSSSVSREKTGADSEARR